MVRFLIILNFQSIANKLMELLSLLIMTLNINCISIVLSSNNKTYYSTSEQQYGIIVLICLIRILT